MVVNIEAWFVVVEKLLMINIHLNQLNEAYPKEKKMPHYRNLLFFLIK
jgi:hypothetical protein